MLHVGTALVTPTEGQLYDPTDGAVTVPMATPDAPWGPSIGIDTPAVSPAAKDALVKLTVKSAAIASLVIMISLLCHDKQETNGRPAVFHILKSC